MYMYINNNVERSPLHHQEGGLWILRGIKYVHYQNTEGDHQNIPQPPLLQKLKNYD